MISVLLIEDHVLVRQGMRLMLEQIQGIQIVGEAGTGREGLALLRTTHSDVVILDFHLPDTTGLDVARKLLRRDPHINILVVSAMEGEVVPIRLLEIGVQGFISKNSDLSELEHAIRSVYSGQRYVSNSVANRLAFSKITAKHSLLSELSHRQMEVLLLLAKGMSVQQIADQLHVDTKTIHTHRYRILNKLGVKNNMSLMKLAIEFDLVE